MKKEDIPRLKEALKVIEELIPSMHSIFKRGVYRIVCERRTDIDQISSAVRIYLFANGIHLTPRVLELLTMFVLYDTSTKSREIISRKIKMSRVAINQNVIALKKAGLIIYPYEDTKKSVIHADLLRLKDYVIIREKEDILVTYVDPTN